MLARFNNKTIIVQRLKTSGNKERYTATSTVEGTYQSLDLEDSIENESISQKTFKAWFDIDTDIIEDDKLVDQNTGRVFRVLGVEKIGEGYGLRSAHLEILMKDYSS